MRCWTYIPFFGSGWALRRARVACMARRCVGRILRGFVEVYERNEVVRVSYGFLLGIRLMSLLVSCELAV